MTGIQIPEIGMGTWKYGAGPDALRSGLDAGALLIDTAESYGTESVVGEAIAGRRSQVFVATKVSAAHFRRSEVFRALEGSLRRLKTDHVDLCQLHEPSSAVPMEETLGAVEELVDQGKVRFVGVSNFSLNELLRAAKAMRRHPIVSNQVRYNLSDRSIDDGLLAHCQAHRVTLIAYSPLGRQFQSILDCDTGGHIASVARETGRTQAQVALNWCIGHPGVVAVPRSNSTAHIVENCGASGWRLSPGQVEELDRGVSHRRRSRLETLLRRHTPPVVKRALLALVQNSPRALRRKLS